MQCPTLHAWCVAHTIYFYPDCSIQSLTLQKIGLNICFGFNFDLQSLNCFKLMKLNFILSIETLTIFSLLVFYTQLIKIKPQNPISIVLNNLFFSLQDLYTQLTETNHQIQSHKNLMRKDQFEKKYTNKKIKGQKKMEVNIFPLLTIQSVMLAKKKD